MGSSIVPELGLDCRFSSEACVQGPIGLFLADFSKIETDSEKIAKLDDFARRLKDEMKKIDAFKRELPLCMILVNDAIEMVEEESSRLRKLNSEPVLEEFIPIKKTCTDQDDDKDEDGEEKDNSSRDKMNWMSSWQLWNTDNNPNNSNTDISINKMSVKVDNNKKEKEEEMNPMVKDNLFQSGKNRELGKAFLPYNKGCSNFPVIGMGKKDMDELPVPGLSLSTPGIKNSREGIDPIGYSSNPCYSRSLSSSATNIQSNFKGGLQQTGRKQRRCWSPELHRQFINALEHLGGPQAATPKQIREHMQVDGLTNDEVKSHLQKYRLHMKRVASNSNSKHVGFWTSQENHSDSMKHRSSLSDSPEGPLQFEVDDGIDDEDYAKSDSSI